MTQYLRTLTRTFAEKWDAFFFTATDPTLTAVLRIATGLMLVYTHLVWGLNLEEFFGTHPWLSADAIQQIQAEQFVYSFWWYVPSELLWPVHWTCIGVLVAFTLGLFTRVTSVLSFVVVISYAHRVPTALFGLDQLNSLLTMYLMLGPCGATLSLDRWWQQRRAGETVQPVPPSVATNVSLRLIQLHMCVIYFFAGLSKLRGDSWWDGQAMWLAFANLEYQSFDMTWLAHHPKVIDLLSHITILYEVFFVVLVWRPLVRPLILTLGVLLHLGIGAFLGMWTFGLIMIVGCSAFIPPDDARRWVDALGRRFAGRRSCNQESAEVVEQADQPIYSGG